MVMTYMYTHKKGQLVQTSRNKRTDTTDAITFPTNTVDNDRKLIYDLDTY